MIIRSKISLSSIISPLLSLRSPKSQVQTLLPRYFSANTAPVAVEEVDPAVSFLERKRYRYKYAKKNLSALNSKHDFHPIENLYANDFEKKQETRKNLWYHRVAHKRANHMIQYLNKEMVEHTHATRHIPEIKPGDALEVKFKGSMEAKRENVFRGVVIGKHNAGYSSSFRILGAIDGVAVEYVFPLYTPLITNIKVVQNDFIHKGLKRTKRAKLYYLKEREPAEYTVTEGHVEAADIRARKDAAATKREVKRAARVAAKEAESHEQEHAIEKLDTTAALEKEAVIPKSDAVSEAESSDQKLKAKTRAEKRAEKKKK